MNNYNFFTDQKIKKDPLQDIRIKELEEEIARLRVITINTVMTLYNVIEEHKVSDALFRKTKEQLDMYFVSAAERAKYITMLLDEMKNL